MKVTQIFPEVRFWKIRLLRRVFLHQQRMKRACVFDCEWVPLRMNEPDSAVPLSHSLSSLVCFPVLDPVTVLSVIASARAASRKKRSDQASIWSVFITNRKHEEKQVKAEQQRSRSSWEWFLSYRIRNVCLQAAPASLFDELGVSKYWILHLLGC